MKKQPFIPQKNLPIKKETSLLDNMIDGREFESLINKQKQFDNVNLIEELRRSINEIKKIRGRHIVCYVANMVQACPCVRDTSC